MSEFSKAFEDFTSGDYWRMFRIWIYMFVAFIFLGMYVGATVLLLAAGAAGAAAISKGKAEKKELAVATPTYKTVDDPEYGIFQGYPCPVWDQNRIERDLGGTDFIKCSNEECPACFPHGTCAVADCREAAEKAWINYSTNEWLCKPHFIVRDMERQALKKHAAEKAKAKELERAKEKARKDAAYEKAALEARDNRPSTVPMYAHASIDKSRGLILWKWLDPKTGKQMGAKQVLPLNLEPPKFDYVVMGDDKPILNYGDFEATIENLEKKIAELNAMEKGGKPTWVHSKVERAESPIKLKVTKEHKDFINAEMRRREKERDNW